MAGPLALLRLLDRPPSSATNTINIYSPFATHSQDIVRETELSGHTKLSGSSTEFIEDYRRWKKIPCGEIAAGNGRLFLVPIGSIWSGRADLNGRPPAPKAGALTRLRYAPKTLLFTTISIPSQGCKIHRVSPGFEKSDVTRPPRPGPSLSKPLSTFSGLFPGG